MAKVETTDHLPTHSDHTTIQTKTKPHHQASASVATSPDIREGTAQTPSPAAKVHRGAAPPVETDKLSIDYLDSLSFNFSEKFEYEQESDSITVKGSLKSHLSFWKEINANDYILDVIEHGYQIPFVTTPSSSYLDNNKSARDNQPFVNQAISELLQTGAVTEQFQIPYVVNPLTVAQNKNKKRLVIDLRYVNPHVWHDKQKFEEWKVALEYINQNDFTTNFDLKSGYHHVDVHPEFQKYLGFAWDFGQGTRYFQFTVLPFGLSTAGYIFTKVLRCLIKHWREQSIKVILYLDDGLIIGSNYNECIRHTQIIRADLLKAGLVVNEPKSNWIPSLIVTWLGVTLSTRRVYLVHT